jgi:hypothetical protein
MKAIPPINAIGPNAERRMLRKLSLCIGKVEK